MNNNQQMYSVKNRSAGSVSYRIPDDNIRRFFAPGEVKQISHYELEKLAYQDGGRALLTEYLQIQSIDAVQELDIAVEPEYWLDEAGVRKLLTQDSLEKFLDVLDFAPQGVIDLVKTMSVALPLNDVAKRQALKEKTGYDVTAAIRNGQEVADAENTSEAPRRRVQSEIATPPRRTTPDYKVVNVK